MMSSVSPVRRAPEYLPKLVVGTAALVLLSPLVAAWNSAPDLGHGWLAPLLLGFLWWERWAELPPARPAPAGLGWWMLLFGFVGLSLLPVRLLLTPYPFWPMAVVIFTGTTIGVGLLLAWMMGGPATVRWFGWPLLLLVAAVPWPTSIESMLILPLREQIAAFTAEISNLLGRPAIAAGTSIRLGSGWVGVDEACGGIRSLQACVLIALFFGEWFRLNLSRRGSLVLAAALAAIAGNFGRVLFLAFRGSAGAIASVHDLAGWTALFLSIIATGALAWHWAGRRFPAPPQQVSPQRALSSHSPVWMVAAVFVGILFFNEAVTRIWFTQKVPAHSVGEEWTARFPSGLETFQTEPLSDVARDMLRPDYYAAGRWRTTEDESVAAYYIEWRKGQVARAIPFLHNPTICLPMAGCELIDAQPGVEVTLAQLKIPFLVYRFRRIDREMLVAFTVWDPTTLAPLKSSDTTLAWRAWLLDRWQDVVDGKQHQPAQMLAIAVPWSNTADQELRWLLGKIVAPRVDTKISP